MSKRKIDDVNRPKLYMGFLADGKGPDVRVGKRGKSLKGVINQVEKRGLKGYVKEYNSGRIVWDNILPDHLQA